MDSKIIYKSIFDSSLGSMGKIKFTTIYVYS